MAVTVIVVNDTQNLVELRAGSHTAEVEHNASEQEWNVWIDRRLEQSYITRTEAVNFAFRQLSMTITGEH